MLFDEKEPFLKKRNGRKYSLYPPAPLLPPAVDDTLGRRMVRSAEPPKGTFPKYSSVSSGNVEGIKEVSFLGLKRAKRDRRALGVFSPLIT
jgi:hypothetical protein